MSEKLYGKNINFLIGSGASYEAIPTLSVDWENNGKNVSVEDILEDILEKDDVISKDIVYTYYYTRILKPSFLKDMNEEKQEVLRNYKKFLEEIIKFLQRENYQKEKRINIFTTNYDLFFEKAADTLTGKYEFFFNDGSSGNITKKLSMKNFHKKIYHTGVFDNFNREIPIINLFKIHGSVSWKYLKDDSKVKEIEVSYQNVYKEDIKEIKEISKEIVKELKDKTEGIVGNRENLRKEFVLVFPEKKKFEETLYEEYYYQYLRQLSYELEKNNSVLIVFGFSFADEHIAELVKRSLSNPGLKIYIFCYNEDSRNMILDKLSIGKVKKVEFILPEDNGSLDFKVFIKKLFNKGDKDE